MSERENRLLAIACAQQGFVTTKQALRAGYASRTHHYHVGTGAWIRIHRGIYRLSGFPATLEAKYVLWSLWSRNRKEIPEGVFSHQTALAIHGRAEADSVELHMTVPPDFRRNAEIPDNLHLHKALLNPADIEQREGYRVVSADCAEHQVYPERRSAALTGDYGSMTSGRCVVTRRDGSVATGWLKNGMFTEGDHA